MNALTKFCCLTALSIVIQGNADTETVNGIKWTYMVSNGEVSVGGGFPSHAVSSSTSGTLVIPSTLGGRPVTSIGSSAFYGCSGLTSVTISDGVTSIGAGAFSGCSGLTSVTIPDSVTSIEGYAFYGCSGLTSVTIPDSVTSIEDSAFYSCSGLKSVTIPDSVTSIGDYAFDGCSGLKSMTIPDSVTSIGGYAFSGCSGLTSVTIPDNVTSIGLSAFAGCSGLMTFDVGVGNVSYKTVDGLILTKDGKTLVAVPGGRTSVTIPDSVTNIASYAFDWCRGLTSVTIPNSVTSIGSSAFSGCSGLTSVTIPNSVTSIGAGAFQACSGLTSVTIPNSVTSIGAGAFYGCSKLNCVYLSLTYSGTVPFEVAVARYKPEQTVTFDVPSGLPAPDAIVVAYGSTYGSLPSLTRLGYSFQGWTVDGVNVYENTIVSALDDHTLSAQWAPIQFSVTFNANGGVGGTSGNQDFDSAIVAPTVTRTGYTFRGWTPNVAATVPANDVTYTAQWTINQYMVTFDASGGVGGTSGTQDYGSAIVAPTVTRDGYTFTGWLPSVAAKITANDVTYVAQWTPNKYTVTFDANGGTGGTSAELDYGSTLVAPTVTRMGYTFKGWSPSVAATVPLGGATYTAQWQINQYTVAFNANGGTGGKSMKQDYGTTIIAPTVTRTGYTFKGWSPTVAATVPANDVTYTAQWEINKYTVIFDANGGTCETEAVTVQHGAALGELPVPARSKAAFLGWFTAVEGGTRIADSTVITEAMALYAHWLTLEEALGVSNGVTVATSADVPWKPMFDSSAKAGDATARSGEIGNSTNTWMSATVSGAGTMSFWCKVSCEKDEDEATHTWDRLMVYTNGVEIMDWRIDGETDWTERTLSFDGGTNTVKWVYFKDRSVSEGEDCAWVDGVTWTPADVSVNVGDGKSVTVSRAWIASHENIVRDNGGDVVKALTSKAANGRLSVVECYVLGLDPENETNDFRIVSFPMKADGTPDLANIVFNPPQERWNVPATYKLKGAATLDGPWADVEDDGGGAAASMRFFKVEVQLP